MDDFKTKVDRRTRQPYQDQPHLSNEEVDARISSWVAERRARGDDQIGLITLDGSGRPYEWCSWERMMSE